MAFFYKIDIKHELRLIRSRNEGYAEDERQSALKYIAADILLENIDDRMRNNDLKLTAAILDPEMRMFEEIKVQLSNKELSASEFLSDMFKKYISAGDLL